MPKVSQQYKDQQRAGILDAARRCFLRNGFHRTSMQDVLSEAGRSAGAVYRYFSSKDEMILAVATQNLADVMEALHSALEAAGPGAEPAAVMATLLDEVAARHADDHLAAVALMVWSEALRSPQLAEKLRQANSAMTKDLGTLVRRRQTADAPDVASPDQTAQVLLAILPGYLLTLALLDASAASFFPDVLRALWPAETVMHQRDA